MPEATTICFNADLHVAMGRTLRDRFDYSADMMEQWHVAQICVSGSEKEKEYRVCRGIDACQCADDRLHEEKHIVALYAPA